MVFQPLLCRLVSSNIELLCHLRNLIEILRFVRVGFYILLSANSLSMFFLFVVNSQNLF
jgi:hypothetical protein